MIIDESPLDFEVQRVINADFTPNFHRYSGQFKVNEKVFDVLKIISIDDDADYELAYGAVRMVRVIMPLGDYSVEIFPNLTNMEFILKTEMTNPDTLESTGQEDSILVETYNVSPNPETRPVASEDNGAEVTTQQIQNLSTLIEIDIQLKPKLLDAISKVSIGGHFFDTTTAQCLSDLITYHCGLLDLEDDQKLIGVNLSGTTSEIVKKSIQIGHGLPLADLADFLQKKAGGVFPSGMAQFVHERIWYVYPPYDTTGFDDAKEKLVIISVPAKRYPQLNKTYVTENGITTILSTGSKRITTNKQQVRDNAGNGAMFLDASKVISGFGVEKGNQAVIKRSENNNEYLGEEVANGNNNVRMSEERITDNPFLARTRLSRGQGHWFSVEWENCDPGVIKPGMHVKILYMNEGEVREITGVLNKIQRHTRMNGKGLMATGHRTNVVLMIFVKSNPDENSGTIGLD